jgi:hypothetical protein
MFWLSQQTVATNDANDKHARGLCPRRRIASPFNRIVVKHCHPVLPPQRFLPPAAMHNAANATAPGPMLLPLDLSQPAVVSNAAAACCEIVCNATILSVVVVVGARAS